MAKVPGLSVSSWSPSDHLIRRLRYAADGRHCASFVPSCAVWSRPGSSNSGVFPRYIHVLYRHWMLQNFWCCEHLVPNDLLLYTS